MEMPGIRFVFAVASFLGVMTSYGIRNNINVAIVSMVNSTAVYHDEGNSSNSSECKGFVQIFNTTNLIPKANKEGPFLWSSREQGTILGAFYYGFIILQIPGGRMAEMYSAKWVFGLGILISALLTLLTPVAAYFHIWTLIALRALEGLAQSVIFPSLFTMISHWCPDSERGFLMGFMQSGVSLGTLASMTATGFLCNSDLFSGWPSTFYVIGLIGVIWFIFWALAVTNTPQSHPFITDKELKYITSNQEKKSKVDLPPFPWLKVMTSLPFWSNIICHAGGSWGSCVMLSQLPTFLATILHFDIEKSGVLSSFPYLIKTIVYMSSGVITDFLMRKELVTVSFIRKFSTIMSHVVSSFFLVGACLSGCNATLYVIFCMCFVITKGFCAAGYLQAPLDMSPEYAGTIKGFTNTVSEIMGFVAPQVVGILTDKQLLSQWQIVFGITAVIQAASGLIFIFFGSSEKQNWLIKES